MGAYHAWWWLCSRVMQQSFQIRLLSLQLALFSLDALSQQPVLGTVVSAVCV